MKQLIKNTLAPFACILIMFSHLSFAATPEQEVEHLISFIAKSNAVFIRNGDKHTSQEAADHLAMKYKKAQRYAKTADDFIENLASKSSWSGKVYTVTLTDGTKLTANDWLTVELTQFRETEKPQ